MNKIFILVILISTFCLGSLAGCGGSPDDDPTAGAAAASSAGTIKTKDGKDTITSGNFSTMPEAAPGSAKVKAKK